VGLWVNLGGLYGILTPPLPRCPCLSFSRRDELVRLEMLCSDAATARDGAKGALANAEKRAAEDRATREAERKELQTLADEQRRKYEAMEARQELMKRAELTRSSAEAGEDAGVQNKLSTAEDMMRKIQEATGVMDVHEVLDRFRSQTETEAKLVSSKEENTKDLSELQDSLATKQREYEALKYVFFLGLGLIAEFSFGGGD
jgi:hypothetical protein